MRDELFAYYVEFGHGLCYKRRYLISCRRISNLYSGFLMLVSAGSIVTLSCWEKYPMLWGIIALLAQILQILKPLMQSEKQRQTLKYIIHDAASLFDELAAYWDTLDASGHIEAGGSEIAAKIQNFKTKMRTSEDRFAGDLDFPFKKRLDKKAQKDNIKYFWYHYGVRPEGGDFYERTKYSHHTTS